MNGLRFLTRHATARPGIGLRMTHQGAQCYYRLRRRRYHPARQFHALGRLGAGRSYHERAVLVSGLWPVPEQPEPCPSCGQRNPKGLGGDGDLCVLCRGYCSPRPAHLARPVWHPRYSSFRLCASRQRPRTRFTYNRFHARYYRTRRRLGAQARRLGFEQVRPGVWFDRAGSVVYLQSAVDLMPTDNVVWALS